MRGTFAVSTCSKLGLHYPRGIYAPTPNLESRYWIFYFDKSLQTYEVPSAIATVSVFGVPSDENNRLLHSKSHRRSNGGSP